MFDFAWSEIAVIAVVALVLIGPKDMPAALKGVSDMIRKARRMAGEFQTHVDDMMRDADLGEVRQQFNEIRSFNIRGAVERAVDSDGTLRRTFTGNPMQPEPAAPTVAAAAVVTAEPAAPAAPPVGVAAWLPATPVPAPAARGFVTAGITPPPVPVRAGASPFEIVMPTVGALTFAPPPPKAVHPPFPSLFGAPVEPAAPPPA